MQNEEDNKHFNHLKTIYNNNLKTILKYSYDFIIKIFKKTMLPQPTRFHKSI